MSDTVTIFHDPTSEPSRAVHWLALEAEIDFDIRYIWLTRGEHISKEFLKVNPLHQVPALQHGDFCLSEASAIMNYITDIKGCSNNWFGHDIRTRATVNKYLSWYHTNLRKVLTLDYFLPVLLMPVYLGIAKPPEVEIEAKLEALHSMFKQLDSMLSGKQYLCGDVISAADILYICEVVALEIDESYDAILEKYPNVKSWLARLQKRHCYTESHKAWEQVVPQILALKSGTKGTPEWVAAECEKILIK